MVRLVKLEMKRLLTNPTVYISVVGIILILFQETLYMTKYRSEYTNVYVFTISTISGLIRVVAPALCVIPYSWQFCKELRDKYYLYATIRVKKNDYIKSRFICGALSAGIVMAIGFLIYSILISIVFIPIDSTNPKHFLDFTGTLWENTYQIFGGIVFFIGQIIIAFIFGFVAGGVSMVVAVLMADKYATIAIPFILYYYIVFVAQRLQIEFLDLSCGIAPLLIIKPIYYNVLITNMCIVVLSYLLFINIGKRRLMNG